jgi:hypothetical protein
MRSMRNTILRIGVIIATLTLAACASGPSTGQTTGGTPAATATATTAPTPTPKPKPTSLPPITQAFCQQLMSIAEANQIMNPSAPADTIKVFASPTGGLCDYLSSASLPSLAGYVMQIQLRPYSGPTPIPEQDIESFFKQGLGQPGVIVGTVTPASGVGDQAGIVVGSYTDPHFGTLYAAAFYVLYGKVVFYCGEVYSSSPTAAQQGALKQCAQLVVGRL